MEIKDYLLRDLNEQATLLQVNLGLRQYEKPTDVEILLLKQPSGEKYAIYRSLWDYGFNPTQSDWLYNYVFLSRHISEKLNRNLTLNDNPWLRHAKNENGFNLLDDSGKFQSEELQQLYEQASTILNKLQTTLSSINAARES